ncbi:MAG: acyl-CoA thioesterase [Pseudonocardia sp.]|uniref:acyl-CoA thioesterase n=1 Tax=unclassified Pseudonocardia TaxID=2619320 RepID=UPI00086ECCB6|nr:MULTISPECIES: thioesterase family protein [unclassified Pseudonocardia]MBN9112621.1 acyl-CoA thioesterase [Pseudonocardia sp.]ODU21356.1 MAG: 4-hydroxybenzoyl-CoA thioesterase [Pseudonocardia sp. SCN 72-51]ODV04705.1 MAG: 4-hydroxybenzoyl-CoA thioesterase [Pseudonocardia sp. SCN 73-27]
MADLFLFPVTVRYLEVDAQNVVFNAWYLAWFDEAMAAFLADRGLPYKQMLDAGHDVQLVRSEIDWRSGVGWGDDVVVAVSTARLGRTSFVLDFDVRRGEEITCAGRTTYVVIGTDGSGKREIPPMLADALGEPAPLRPV